MMAVQWWLKISRSDNGYRLLGSDDADFVIQARLGDELDQHEQLLWAVMEYFNFEGTKHDPERLRVVREKREE